ncbi:hypothetical protein [Fluviicola chungangensis]|uniref:Lipoprotein n=1 Tax=Fluviicola chungangensis TaxID=2597671 RepID=A0A556N6Z8_9FLAO|nr:hypothetical protein [Fluviicola chungangensis]TSJ47956.1 hypothetical protein FO442_02145 [Fluviicola chungangensis]
MKRVIFAIVVLSGFALASCKKDYTCECRKIRTDDNGNTVTNSDGTYTFKDTRPRAEDRCNDMEETGTDLLGSYTRECDI